MPNSFAAKEIQDLLDAGSSDDSYKVKLYADGVDFNYTKWLSLNHEQVLAIQSILETPAECSVHPEQIG